MESSSCYIINICEIIAAVMNLSSRNEKTGFWVDESEVTVSVKIPYLQMVAEHKFGSLGTSFSHIHLY